MQIDKTRQTNNLLAILLCAFIFIIIFLEIILNLTPPIDRDALIHHLAIPKLWLKNGGFYETTWAVFSYYPMNIDILYLFPLYFKMDFLAKFIHMLFGLGTAFLIYHYLKTKISRLAGLLGVVLFLSTPIIFRLSTEAYNDLGLIFFTTAAILAFVRYRDSEFNESKWLIWSAVAMGLALGTKYNALVAWFFLTLSFVYMYSKATGKQWQALRQGFIFFAISLILFSPWLIKNFLLTGNPLFPLFHGFFMTNSAPSQGETYAIVSGSSYKGIFQLRQAMYGEGFWDTLLIPFRYFFQGQDNNPQFFDGVLNPLLILLPSFAFINKSLHRDKLFFVAFCAFFILLTTFLDQTRIRYILPVVPLLAILSVMGCVNIFRWATLQKRLLKNALLLSFLCVLIALMGLNVFYIRNYFQFVNPINYVTGKESRDAFLSNHIGSYPAMQYINGSTPESSKIRLIFLASRGYYLDRAYEDDSSMGMSFIYTLVKSPNGDANFQNRLHSSGYTHLLVRTDSFSKYLNDNFTKDEINRFLKNLNTHAEVIFYKNGYAVYKIFPKQGRPS